MPHVTFSLTDEPTQFCHPYCFNFPIFLPFLFSWFILNFLTGVMTIKVQAGIHLLTDIFTLKNVICYPNKNL